MIDDELSVILSIKRLLCLYDVEVDYSLNAKAAMPIVEGGDYDYVLLDYCMPEYNGEWFMKHVRLPFNTQVVLLTAYATSEILEKMMELGISDYWIKPISGKQIIDKLNRQSELAMQ